MSKEGGSAPPRRQFAVHGKAGVQVIWGPPDAVATHDKLACIPGNGFKYSSDSTRLAVSHSSGVSIYDSETGALLTELSAPGVKAMSFSPKNTYLVTWEPLTSRNRDPGNLAVWEVATGTDIHRFLHQNLKQDKWPVRWNPSETVCARLVTSALQFYADGRPQERYSSEISLAKLSGFSMCEVQGLTRVAISVTEAKGKPASVRLYNYPNLRQPVCQRSFFKADSIDLMWSPTGTALLALTQTEADKTGQSYYGETNLYFLQADGAIDIHVPLTKEGPIHDVAWNPSGKDFVVVHGFMPAKTLLFDTKCVATFDFGDAPRNTVKYSPHGRFLCLAGFGNLQGEMDFWDRNKLKKIGYALASCAVSFAWSPCSRYCLTATLFPRLRVDNGYKIWAYDGRLVHEQGFDEIYEVGWRHTPVGVYPDRPASPRAKGEDGAPVQPVAVAPVRKAYVPPHLRNRSGGGESAKLIDRDEDGPKRLSAAGSQPAAARGPSVPGATFAAPSENKSKSAQKRAKQLAKKREAEAIEKAKQEAEAAAAGQPLPSDSGDASKRIKAITKKLRQIENLKAKQATGEILDMDQMSKIESEHELQMELKELQQE